MKKNLLFVMACAAAMVGGCAFDEEKANKADSGETAPTTIVGNTTNEEPASEADKAEDKGDKGETKAEPECFLDSDCNDGFSCNSLKQCVERTVNPPPADTDDAGDAGTDDFGGEPVEPDEQETCTPTGDGDEICNGIDDNCSGMKDEGDLCTLGRSCKSGACACATGTALCDACTNTKTDRNNCGGCGVKCDADEVCQEGKCIGPDDPEPEPEPTPTCTPQAEICDGKDNDCDGATDEGDDGKALFRSCGFDGATPQGECQRGTQTCTVSSWGTCAGLISSVAETCDGKDNDCDGAIDNGVKNACGGCGVVVELCGTDGKGNNIDDDCNGLVDEDCTCTSGVKEACGAEKAGKGPCKAGERICQAGGVWGECVGAILPVAEKCDTVDNDCDGTVNEDFSQLGDPCGEGVGVCVASGTFVCKADKSGTECNATAGTPATEICDGLDNDCDGTKDDGQLCTDGQSCTSGACVCPSGTTLCGQNCRALQEDESNCGGCGSACASGEICNAGSCGTPPPCESGTVRVKYTTPTGKSGLIEVRDPGPLGTVYCASTTVTNSLECVFTPPAGASVYIQIDVDTNSDGIMDYTTGDLWGCNFWQGTGRIDGAIQAWKCGSGGAETAATVTALSVYGGGNCEIK